MSAMTDFTAGSQMRSAVPSSGVDSPFSTAEHLPSRFLVLERITTSSFLDCEVDMRLTSLAFDDMHVIDA
jgi:hypothetical protein